MRRHVHLLAPAIAGLVHLYDLADDSFGIAMFPLLAVTALATTMLAVQFGDRDIDIDGDLTTGLATMRLWLIETVLPAMRRETRPMPGSLELTQRLVDTIGRHLDGEAVYAAQVDPFTRSSIELGELRELREGGDPWKATRAPANVLLERWQASLPDQPDTATIRRRLIGTIDAYYAAYNPAEGDAVASATDGIVDAALAEARNESSEPLEVADRVRALLIAGGLIRHQLYQRDDMEHARSKAVAELDRLLAVRVELSLGARIQTRLDELGWTHDQLARMLDIDRSAVTYWVTDRYRPRNSHLSDLARILDVPVGYLR